MPDPKINDIQETIIQIYSKNLNFFSKYHKRIYNKILNLERLNKYKHQLTFENNHFDIKNKDNIFTYNCDPYFDAQHRVKQVESSNGFLMIKIDKKYQKIKYENEEMDPYLLLDDYIEIIKDAKNKKINSNKIIFLGTILGIHITDILNQHKFQYTLLIEDDLEIFRLSMFITDYEDLSFKTNLSFCINEDSKQHTLKAFLDYSPEYNHMIKFEVASEREVPLIEDISNLLPQENELNYPFTEYVISYSRGIKYVSNNHKLLKLHKIHNILNDKPILYLGAGLSLKENIQFIIENNSKFIIVCVAAILTILEKYNIIPDVIISSDSSPIIKQQFLVNDLYFKDSILFMSNKTHTDVMNILPKNNTFLFNDSLEVFQDTGVNTGFNVGNTGYSILLKLGITDIYLLGFDASLNKDTRESHSNKNKKISSEIKLIEVKGNILDKVTSTSHFNGMITSFGDEKRSEIINAFNLSNGAYLPGIKPLELNSIILNEVINKKQFKNKILLNLNKISKNKISQKEKELIKKEMLTIQRLKELDNHNLFKSYSNFLSEEKNKNTLIQIIHKYYNLISPYFIYIKTISEDKANKVFIDHHKKLINYLNSNFYFKS